MYFNYNQLLCILFILFLTGCVKHTDFDTPNSCANDNLVANTTYQKVKELFIDHPVRIQEDLIIEGIVTSSDQAGNFFGTLHFQDAAINPEEGFQIDIDVRDYHLQFDVGETVFIKLKGLYLGRSQETYKLGGLFTTAGGTLAVGRLPGNLIDQHIISSCKPINEIIPQTVKPDAINSSHINTLITITDVQISPTDMCKSYAEEATVTERKLEDCNGNQIELVNSGYSDFQAEILPTGMGTVTGILGYNSGKYHITIRHTDDLELNQPRCDETTFTCEPPQPTTTIKALKETYQGEPIKIEENLVVEGMITATDETKNFYKEVYLQDTTSGIKININSTRLFELGFELNRAVILNCKGLTLTQVNEELQLGFSTEEEFNPIPEEQLYKYIYLQEYNFSLEPFTLTLAELTPEDIGKWVELEALQFTYPATPFVENNSDTNHTVNDCFGNIIEVSTRKNATFKDVVTPNENGNLQGILTSNNNTYVLKIRHENDVAELTNNRCNLEQTAQLTTINSLRALVQNEPYRIHQNLKIKATVISDSENGNFETTELIVQDNDAGIKILFNTPPDLPVNTEVEIWVWNGLLSLENNGLVLANLNMSHIISSTIGSEPEPIPLQMEQLTDIAYQNRYISINDVQFTPATNFTESTRITDCDFEVAVPVKQEASFYNNPVPDSKGNIKGVLTSNNEAVLRIRSTSDFQPTGNSQICYLTESNNVFISELADPNNNADARFVELYNAGTIDVLLDGWKLIRYTNGNTEISSEIDFTGYKIKAGETFVISPDATVFQQVYGFQPDYAASANSPADSNGDDNLVLLNANGEVVDIFGVIGEDGSGTNHEFEDGSANRKAHITQGNSSYTFAEWEIFNDTGGSGTTNQPQNAPEDFTPGQR